MPVPGIRWDESSISRKHLYGFLTFQLIVPASANSYKHLPAALGSAVDMPVVAASRFKSDIRNSHPLSLYRSQIAFPVEILGICIVRFPDREEDSFCIFA